MFSLPVRFTRLLLQAKSGGLSSASVSNLPTYCCPPDEQVTCPDVFLCSFTEHAGNTPLWPAKCSSLFRQVICRVLYVFIYVVKEFNFLWMMRVASILWNPTFAVVLVISIHMQQTSHGLAPCDAGYEPTSKFRKLNSFYWPHGGDTEPSVIWHSSARYF